MEINKADADNLHFQSDFHKSSSIEKTLYVPELQQSQSQLSISGKVNFPAHVQGNG